tara:strand:- start:891 stop:1883 length:993 start_codon:yes stop_codon:yes gene_type:complete
MSALHPEEVKLTHNTSNQLHEVQEQSVQQLGPQEVKMEMDNQTALNDNKANAKTYTRRILIHCNASSEELAAGKHQVIPNANRIFQPDFSQADNELKKELDNLDLSRGIVSKVSIESVYSNCPAPVVLGLKLFQRPDSTKAASYEDLRITNNSGWLYSCSESKMGSQASHSKSGVTNIYAFMPYERTRHQNGGTVVYEPSNVISNKYIQQYGSFNWKNLWSGVVQFPGESFYYVDKSHVVLRIIENNWEILGMDVKNEQPREGRYVKIATNVCDRVIKELYDNIISRIPYTKWKNIAAVFSSDNIDESMEGDYKFSVEMKVSFIYPNLTQ